MRSTVDIERYLQYNMYDLFGQSWDAKLVITDEKEVPIAVMTKLQQSKVVNCLKLEYSSTFPGAENVTMSVFLNDFCDAFFLELDGLDTNNPCAAKVEYMSGWEGFFFGVYTLFECSEEMRDFLMGLKDCFDFMRDNKIEEFPTKSNKQSKHTPR